MNKGFVSTICRLTDSIPHVIKMMPELKELAHSQGLDKALVVKNGNVAEKAMLSVATTSIFNKVGLFSKQALKIQACFIDAEAVKAEINAEGLEGFLNGKTFEALNRTAVAVNLSIDNAKAGVELEDQIEVMKGLTMMSDVFTRQGNKASECVVFPTLGTERFMAFLEKASCAAPGTPISFIEEGAMAFEEFDRLIVIGEDEKGNPVFENNDDPISNDVFGRLMSREEQFERVDGRKVITAVEKTRDIAELRLDAIIRELSNFVACEDVTKITNRHLRKFCELKSNGEVAIKTWRLLDLAGEIEDAWESVGMSREDAVDRVERFIVTIVKASNNAVKMSDGELMNAIANVAISRLQSRERTILQADGKSLDEKLRTIKGLIRTFASRWALNKRSETIPETQARLAEIAAKEAEEAAAAKEAEKAAKEAAEFEAEFGGIEF